LEAKLALVLSSDHPILSISLKQEHIDKANAAIQLQRQQEDDRRREQQIAQRSSIEAAMKTVAAKIITSLEHAIGSASNEQLLEAVCSADRAIESQRLLAGEQRVVALRADAHARLVASAEKDIVTAIADGDVFKLEASIAAGRIVPPPMVESLQKSIANAVRSTSYLALRRAKPNHTTWTGEEVIVAFVAVSHLKELAADSIDAAIQYFRTETIDGRMLAVVASDNETMQKLAPSAVRRTRLAQTLDEIISLSGPNLSATAPPPANGANVAADTSATVFGPSWPPPSVDEHDADFGVATNQGATSGAELQGPTDETGGGVALAPSSDGSVLNLADRLVDTDASHVDDGLSAITGIAFAPLLNLTEAAQLCGVKGTLANIKVAVKFASTKINRGQGGDLSADEIAAIHLYTQASDFYRTLNRCLRNRDRDLVKPFFPYLRLLLGGLRKLPKRTRTVYRGVKRDLSATFKQGDEPVWWSVSSTSSSMAVLNSNEFCGQSGARTVFVVQAAHARDIAAFSAFASEEELILLPGAQLLVKAVVPMGGGLHLVQMDETDGPLSLLEFEDE
jgi:hypothetical protein